MKKILLIPTLLATSIAPLSCLASLSSCSEQKRDYLTFEALEDGQMSCDIDFLVGDTEINLDVKYSLNNGAWTTLKINKTDGEYTNYLTYKSGDKIRLKGVNDHWSYHGEYNGYCTSLHFTGLVNASGNIMSLLYGDDFVDKKTIPCEACFQSLFDSSNYFGKNGEHLEFVQIHDAQNLILPATALTSSCYYDMFNGCIDLINAPALPATTLADSCYYEMFLNCDSLVIAPELPATALADDCYRGMFSSCDALKVSPALPATVLADRCYYMMFCDCESLVDAPELPATTLADSCYYEMFLLCDSLVDAPSLPAETLAEYCYGYMFEECDALIKAPMLPATTLAKGCYLGMFSDCDKLINAPKLQAMALTDSCYRNMFKNCTSLIVNTEGDSEHLIFECPQTEGLIRPVTDMFASTKGIHDDTPVTGTSYYWAEE